MAEGGYDLLQEIDVYEDLQPDNFNRYRTDCPVCCGNGKLPKGVITKETPTLIQFNKEPKPRRGPMERLGRQIMKTYDKVTAGESTNWDKIHGTFTTMSQDFLKTFAADPVTANDLKDYQFLKKFTMDGETTKKRFLVKDSRFNDVFFAKAYKKGQIIHDRLGTSVVMERKLLTAMHFPFIVDMPSRYGGVYAMIIFQEYLTGKTLQDMVETLAIKRNFPSAQTLLFYAAQICLTVSYLHEMRIMHRALDPSKWVHSSTGFIKLVGFSHAKYFTPEEKMQMPSTHTVPIKKKGENDEENEPETPKADLCLSNKCYSLPESRVGQQAYGPECDWWSVGCILHFLEFLEKPWLNPEHPDESITYVQISTHKKHKDDPSSKVYEDLVNQLTVYNLQERLRAPSQVLNHPLFDNYDFKMLLDQHDSMRPNLGLLSNSEMYVLPQNDPNRWEEIQPHVVDKLLNDVPDQKPRSGSFWPTRPSYIFDANHEWVRDF